MITSSSIKICKRKVSLKSETISIGSITVGWTGRSSGKVGIHIISKKKKIIITAALVLISSIVAITSKVMLPSDVNVGDFNSIFVRSLGFEAVASLYFILIYAHNAIVTATFGRRSELTNRQIGLRFGICFALVYLFGMQEVVVESSPFTTWGIDFVIYQFFGGAGEAIAALCLCMAISIFVIERKEPTQIKAPMPFRNKALAILLITSMFTTIRAIGYETGIIHSNVDRFPVPVYIWTVLFGIVLGACFIMIYPAFGKQKSPAILSVKTMILTVGLSWIIFNLFIGLIFAGALVELLLRGGLDVLAAFLAALVWSKTSIKITSKITS